MSWVKMTMKFPGKCTVCGKTVDTGQVGFWARGMGVKHEEYVRSSSICNRINDMYQILKLTRSTILSYLAHSNLWPVYDPLQDLLSMRSHVHRMQLLHHIGH